MFAAWSESRRGISRRLGWVCVLGLAAASLCCGRMAAAAEPLERLPADVSVLIRLKALDATVEKTVALANQVMPGTGQMVQQSAAAVGMAISNPTLAGVDRKRDWWVAVSLYSDREPETIFAIPTTDSEALIKALGDRFTVRVDGNWAYYSEQPDALKRLDAAARESASTLLQGPVRAAFDDGDLAVLLNVPELVRTYDAQLRGAEEHALQSLEESLKLGEQPDAQSPDGRPIPEELRKNLPRLIGLAKSAVRRVFQTVRETQAVVLAVAADGQGVRVDELVTFQSGSETERFVRNLAGRPVDTAAFDRLPPGKLVYGGWFLGVTEFYEWALQIAAAVAPNDEAKQTLDDVKSTLGDLKVQSYVGAGWLGDLQSGLLRSVTVFRLANPAALPEGIRKLVRSGTGLGALISNAYSPGQRTNIEFEPEAEEYDGLKADVLRTRIAIDEKTDPLGIGRAILSAMYGPEGMVVRLLYIDDAVVQVMGTREDVREVVQAYRAAQRSSEPEFVRMRKLLPQRPAAVAMLDVASLLVQGAKIAAGSGKLPIPITPEMLQGLRVEPSYLAVGASVQQGGVQLRIVVPTKQLQGLVQIGMFARQMFLQLRNAQPPEGAPPSF